MSGVKQSEILDILSLIEVQSATCGKIRIGGDNDGGYVMANDFQYNQIAYSIGVGPQVLWDIDMAERGVSVYQYDHTVEGLPQEHPLFHYERLGIGFDMSDPQLITLKEMMRRNNHVDQRCMLLKMDVEGAEWDVFDQMEHVVLSHFDQIVIEFHALEYLSERSFYERAKRVFKKLNYYHAPIHVHANNYGNTTVIEGVFVPTVIEMSFALKSRFVFNESAEIFPTKLDQPCRSDQPDIFLGQFKFRSKVT